MASVQEFASRIKAKYPQYADVDDEDLARRIVDKYPAYKDSVTFEAATTPDPIANEGNTKPEVRRIPEGIGPGETVMRGLMPRSFKAAEDDAGIMRQATAGALDALSAPGRIAGSLQTPDPNSRMMPVGFGGGMIPVQPDAVSGRAPGDNAMFEAMADTEGQNLGQRVLRDPALLPSLAVGGPLAQVVGKAAPALGLASKVVPAVTKAPTVAKVLGGIGAKALQAGGRAALVGAGEGVVSAAVHQADRAAQGQDVDLGEAGVEVALSAIMPAIISGTGTAAKETGKSVAKGVMQTALKPAKGLMQGRGSKLDIQKIFDFNLDSPKGLEAMDDKIKAFRDNVKAQYGEVLDANKGKKFNIRGALAQAVREAEDELANFKNADQVEGIKKGIEYWKNYLKNTSLKINNGWMPVEDVAGLRAGVWGAAKFNVQSPPGYAEFAEKFGHKINDQLGNILPAVRPLDAQLAATRPMRRAAEDAMQRVGNNRYIGLMDAIGGASAIGGALATGDIENAKWGLGLALGARALRSPGFASTLYRGADAMPALSPISPLQLAGRRIGGGLFRDEERKRP